MELKYFIDMRRLSKFTNKVRVAALSAALTLSSSAAFADDNLGKEVIESATDGLVDLLDSLVTLLQVVMGLGALVCLTIVIFKVFKGDREAAEKLAWWVAGLTIGFVLITVVKNLIPA